MTACPTRQSCMLRSTAQGGTQNSRRPITSGGGSSSSLSESRAKCLASRAAFSCECHEVAVSLSAHSQGSHQPLRAW